MTTLRSLIARLSPRCRSALEAAAAQALTRTHFYVEIEHILAALLDMDGSDLSVILRESGVDIPPVLARLEQTLAGLKAGNVRAPGLSPELVGWFEKAWLAASLEEGVEQVCSGHLLLAGVGEGALRHRFLEIFPDYAAIAIDTLRRDVAACQNEQPVKVAGEGRVNSGLQGGSQDALQHYCVDLTEKARQGHIDPIVGRSGEIAETIEILGRRRQNNPVLVGDPGVGKTAVVEGLASLIASGNVIETLRSARVLSLDLGLLQAGAGVKGEFEKRLRAVIDGVVASPTPIILFIDEAHTLIGAGGQAGQNDAANLLKPALARGELRCIAATTWSEYKKYIEKDAALARRFQAVQIGQPDAEVARAMLRSMVPALEKHHDVHIIEEALHAAVSLSTRYIASRQLPDKAVSLLDTACSRVAQSQVGCPVVLEKALQRRDMLQLEKSMLEQECLSGLGSDKARTDVDERLAQADRECETLDVAWQRERALVEEIKTLQARPATTEADKITAVQEALQNALAQLVALQGDKPLVFPLVDKNAVAAVVEEWTGVPVGRMAGSELEGLLGLSERLQARVLGQDHALEAIAKVMLTQRAGLADPRKPAGVFLLVGTSGVGKTETALALAEALYGGEQNLTVINMSEFKEEHKVSLLMGAPPGYVGYGEGGVLTEAVRRKPYSVILLDEMEKAHPGVQDVFYQVFDKGQMKDGEGRDIDFRNTVILMTSNAGSESIAHACANRDNPPEQAELLERLRPDLLRWFRPAFLGRCTTVAYYPLSDLLLRKIIEMNFLRIRSRLLAAWNAKFVVSDAVIDALLLRCHEVDSGARVVESVLSHTLLPALSQRALERLVVGQKIACFEVGIGEDGTLTYAVT
ncbi:MAG: type VI secretion system ATPase TssH [Acetobacter sp.]